MFLARGGVLAHIGYIGKCGAKEYGFWHGFGLKKVVDFESDFSLWHGIGFLVYKKLFFRINVCSFSQMFVKNGNQF